MDNFCQSGELVRKKVKEKNIIATQNIAKTNKPKLVETGARLKNMIESKIYIRINGREFQKLHILHSI